MVRRPCFVQKCHMRRLVLCCSLAVFCSPFALSNYRVEAEQDRLAALNFEGTEQVKPDAIIARLRAHNIAIRLDQPMARFTTCLVKEVIRDLMAERGFVNADVSHRMEFVGKGEAAATKLTFDIRDGRRAQRVSAADIEKGPSPRQRCLR